VTVVGKVGLSLVLVVGALLLLYMSAYAFSVNRTLLSILQWGLLLLTLIAVGAVWRFPGPWLVPALVVVGVAVLVLFARMGGVF